MAFLHFLFENFFMTVSLKDCALLVKLFYKNYDCTPVALQWFQTLKSMNIGLLTVHCLLKIAPKFEKISSFDLQTVVEGGKELIRQ